MFESNIKLNFSFLEILTFIKEVGCIDRSYMKAQVKVKEKTSQIFYEYPIILLITSQLDSVLGIWQNTTNTNL